MTSVVRSVRLRLPLLYALEAIAEREKGERKSRSFNHLLERVACDFVLQYSKRKGISCLNLNLEGEQLSKSILRPRSRKQIYRLRGSLRHLTRSR